MDSGNSGGSSSSSSSSSDFIWGAATAAYQIEGAWDADGKGPSIWDDFCHEGGGRVRDSATGDEACQSYTRYREDVQLLKAIGVSHYRFSISWPRVLPDGTLAGGVNEPGVRYYSNLVDELLSNGIQPMVTLFHWDLPSALQLRLGGWKSERTVQHFVEFADVMFERLGDRVKLWATFNEPAVFALHGHATGCHAPGLREPQAAPYLVGHHLLLAHALTHRLYSQRYRQLQGGRVGIVLSASWRRPRDPDSPEDRAAAERAMQFQLGWFASPVVHGDYPVAMRTQVDRKSPSGESRLPAFTQQQRELLAGSFDFLGINQYTSELVSHADLPGQSGHSADADCELSPDPAWPTSGSAWLRVEPSGMRGTLGWVARNYGNPPVFITENGVSDNTGCPRDEHRISYLRQYIESTLDAKRLDGCNLQGYFVWSLLDNFEWAEGYAEKFGICRVDFDSPERRRELKDSAKWLAEFIATHRRL